MTSIAKSYGLALFATLAVAAGAYAQEQSDQQRDEQSSQQNQQSDQSQQPQQAENQNQQNASQSDSQSDEQARQRDEQQRQQQEQERQRQEQKRQLQQQDSQRDRDSQQRDQQSRDRDQSSWRDSDSSRVREWPQPNGREYGSDSLSYRQQQGRGEQQGGLGVGLRSDGREGVVVSHVHSGSPAEEMGIRSGDRITAVNGRQIQSVQQFIARIRNMEPGQQIELDIRRARSGDEQTVQGELETRREALAEHADQGEWSTQQGNTGRDDQSGRQDRGNWQTSYDEQRGSYSQGRSDQMSGNRLDQIERQVDRLSRQIDDLRVALQNIRRDAGQSTQWNRERTARYEEYQGTTGQREYDGRLDGRETYRDSDRDRDFDTDRQGRSDSDRGTITTQRGSRSAGRDTNVDTPGGETGEDRLHVGSEDARE